MTRQTRTATFKSETGEVIHEATRAFSIVRDGVTYLRQKREKPKSRNDRKNEIVSSLESKRETIQEMLDAVESGEFTNETFAGMPDFSEEEGLIEELKDELQNWLDSIPDNLRSGEKASSLEDAISNLDEAINYLSGISPSLEMNGNTDKEELSENLKSELQSVLDDSESAISSLDDTEFPGMFG